MSAPSTPQYLFFSARGVTIVELTSILQDRTIYLKQYQQTGEGAHDKPFFLSFRAEHVHDWLDYVRTGDKTKLAAHHVGFLNRLATGGGAPAAAGGDRKMAAGGADSELHKLMAQTISESEPRKNDDGGYIYLLELPDTIKNLPIPAKKKLAGTFDVRGMQLKDAQGNLLLYDNHYLDLKTAQLHLKPLRSGR